jgi:hypothetical protein
LTLLRGLGLNCVVAGGCLRRAIRSILSRDNGPETTKLRLDLDDGVTLEFVVPQHRLQLVQGNVWKDFVEHVAFPLLAYLREASDACIEASA